MILKTMLVHVDTAAASAYLFTSSDRGTTLYKVDGLMPPLLFDGLMQPLLFFNSIKG